MDAPIFYLASEQGLSPNVASSTNCLGRSIHCKLELNYGQGGRDRTCYLLLPKQADHQFSLALILVFMATVRDYDTPASSVTGQRSSSELHGHLKTLWCLPEVSIPVLPLFRRTLCPHQLERHSIKQTHGQLGLLTPPSSTRRSHVRGLVTHSVSCAPYAELFIWQPRRDLNPHTRRCQNLNLVRLPIPPRGHVIIYVFKSNIGCWGESCPHFVPALGRSLNLLPNKIMVALTGIEPAYT